MTATTLSNLPENVFSHIGSFLNFHDARKLGQSDRLARGRERASRRSRYTNTFGETPDFEQQRPAIIARLLFFAGEQFDPTRNYNVYGVPTSRSEWLKWIVGADNQLDRQVGQDYRALAEVLENSVPGSMTQAFNRTQTRKIVRLHRDHYEQFRKTEQTRAKRNLLRRVFFACIGFFFKLRFGSTRERIYDSDVAGGLWCCRPIVQIGAFTVGGPDPKNYRVLANLDLGFVDDSLRSIWIRVFEETAPPRAPEHCFRITKEGNRWDSSGWYLGNDSHLLNLTGSNGELDQKLAQVMVEVIRQNSGVEEPIMDSKNNHDGAEVLFKIGNIQPILQFARETSRSWAEIIREKPILRQGAAIFPE